MSRRFRLAKRQTRKTPPHSLPLKQLPNVSRSDQTRRRFHGKDSSAGASAFCLINRHYLAQRDDRRRDVGINRMSSASQREIGGGET
jgi:hypothetical protein